MLLTDKQKNRQTGENITSLAEVNIQSINQSINQRLLTWLKQHKCYYEVHGSVIITVCNYSSKSGKDLQNRCVFRRWQKQTK